MILPGALRVNNDISCSTVLMTIAIPFQTKIVEKSIFTLIHTFRYLTFK